jgi:hypothetical protein
LRVLTIASGNRTARLFPHLATRISNSLGYTKQMYILPVFARRYKFATPQSGLFLSH